MPVPTGTSSSLPETPPVFRKGRRKGSPGFPPGPFPIPDGTPPGLTGGTGDHAIIKCPFASQSPVGVLNPLFLSHFSPSLTQAPNTTSSVIMRAEFVPNSAVPHWSAFSLISSESFHLMSLKATLFIHLFSLPPAAPLGVWETIFVPHHLDCRTDDLKGTLMRHILFLTVHQIFR